jgi:hypothetical protein
MSYELVNTRTGRVNALGGVVTLEGSVAHASPAVAKIAPDEIAVRHSVRVDVGQEFLDIDCPEGWDDVKKLVKKVLIYDNRRFTFRGWNSDRNECFFSRLLSGPENTAKIVRRQKGEA